MTAAALRRALRGIKGDTPIVLFNGSYYVELDAYLKQGTYPEKPTKVAAVALRELPVISEANNAGLEWRTRE